MTNELVVDQKNVFVRFFLYVVNRFRPPLGWVVWCVGLLIALLPAIAIREAAWIDLGRVRVTPEWVSLFGLVSAWLLVDRLRDLWERTIPSRVDPALDENGHSDLPAHRSSGRLAAFFIFGLCFLLWTLLGAVTVSQVLVHWIPGPIDLWRAAMAYDLRPLAEGVSVELNSLVLRYSDWARGVEAGGAYQDDFVFLTLFGVVLWYLGGITALLALSTRNGLIVGTPALWVLATFLFYGRQGRLLILIGFASALLLHVLLDHQRMERNWARQRTDFSPMLLTDRMLSVGAGAVLIGLVAAFMPNIVISPLAYRVYQTMTPVYDSVDEVTERMFPDLKGGRRGLGRLGSGLPNRFLLEGGTELGQYEVMRVSTNYPFGAVTEMGDMPPRLYMRRGTFVNYDGRGWNNSGQQREDAIEANRDWRSQEDWPGRVALTQRVRLTSPTAVLPAAGEPAMFRTEYELERRASDDLVSVWSGTGPVDRYEVVSFVPAMSVESLRALPAWGNEGAVLPPDMVPHLRVPESVTTRTRDLADRLAEGQPGPFAIAESIEAHLRGIEYNLEVPGPPPGADVADFFLFDLRQGYCDYYTTAFAVLARLNGLPTRFATGHIGGYWDLESGEWTITEAEAHSWPEVYLPEIGWVQFEPTAGRPTLQRQAALQTMPDSFTRQPAGDTPQETSTDEWSWNWQMLFWLLPVAGLLYLAGRWFENRPQDPWHGLLAWGRRIGWPHQLNQTELEYGQGLSAHLADHETEPERRRRLTRNVVGLTAAVSQERYGTAAIRPAALERAVELWRAMRTDIRRLPW
ncbi:MAG: transglutaminase domain-containing protein [Caldilineaceae bacterium]|nr:transglutaminase domain-containing protein [Caldilineaceae bacterium]